MEPSKANDPLAIALAAALRNTPHPARRLLVAYSGGLDSSVLLHACAGLIRDRDIDVLRAIHLNHGLQPAADGWAEHCAARCAEWNVALTIVAVTVDAGPRESLEMAARRIRYAAFATHLQPGEVLLTAHHADDQLETVLMRLLRGSGPRGLGGIRPWQPFAAGFLARPLLAFPRDVLREYAQRHQLTWVEDASNADLAHDRNRLRARVVPELLARWPQAPHTVVRSARLLREADQLLAELAALDLGVPLNAGTLPLAALQGLSAARQRNVLHQVLLARGLPLPSADRLEEARRQLCEAAPYRSPAIAWPGVRLRRIAGRIHLFAEPQAPPAPATESEE